jgi:hypothetical protein
MATENPPWSEHLWPLARTTDCTQGPDNTSPRVGQAVCRQLRDVELVDDRLWQAPFQEAPLGCGVSSAAGDLGLGGPSPSEPRGVWRGLRGATRGL